MQQDSHSKDCLRSLGHVQLCGILHAVWQTREGANGQYLISLLYKNFLVLATTDKAGKVYTIQAKVGLADIKVEEADNGRGSSDYYL